MAYKELKVSEMSTGELATAYHKLDKMIKRAAGGCWELANNKLSSIASHRLHIFNKRLPDGTVDVVTVKTIDLIRHREGFRVEDNRGYEMSCHNPRCLNPVHQVSPRSGNRTVTWSAEDMEKCGLLRKYGWSTHYQRTSFAYSCYLSVKGEAKYAPVTLVNAGEVVKLEVVNSLLTLFKIDGEQPTIDDMMALTGLTFEELLPYGYAVMALEQRTKTQSRRDMCGAMLRGFIQGLPVREIALRNNIPPTTIYAFRGSLYG